MQERSRRFKPEYRLRGRVGVPAALCRCGQESKESAAADAAQDPGKTRARTALVFARCASSCSAGQPSRRGPEGSLNQRGDSPARVMSVASAARRTPLRSVPGSTPFPSRPLRRPGVRETSCWGVARGRGITLTGQEPFPRGLFRSDLLRPGGAVAPRIFPPTLEFLFFPASEQGRRGTALNQSTQRSAGRRAAAARGMTRAVGNCAD